MQSALPITERQHRRHPHYRRAADKHWRPPQWMVVLRAIPSKQGKPHGRRIVCDDCGAFTMVAVLLNPTQPGGAVLNMRTEPYTSGVGAVIRRHRRMDVLHTRDRVYDAATLDPPPAPAYLEHRCWPRLRLIRGAA